MKTMLLASVALALVAGVAMAAAAESNVARRGSLENARLVFQNTRKGHVAFMGGSITEMDGYRPMVAEMLKQRFPDTAFTFTAAGISSTCSTTGAFRLKTDVLDQGPVDLFFVEFAVNDDQDGHHTPVECLRGMEGILRHARRYNPKMDIVIVHFVNPPMMDAYRQGKTPVPIAAHEQAAERYGVSTINLCREVTSRIDAGALTWEKFGGVHPGPLGNRMAADMIKDLMDACWKDPPGAGAATKGYPLPEPVDRLSYSQGRFVDVKEARGDDGWAVRVPDWKALPGGKRERFTTIPILECTKPGVATTLEFSGTAVGAYVVAGPDAGMVEAVIDGGAPARVDLFHGFSAGLHYPRTVMFADALAPGKHTLTLRLLGEHNAKSSGTAARIMQFTVNEAP